MYRTLPTTLSLELRMQRYDNFLNPPNFRRSFFSSASLVRLTPIILYIGAPSDALNIKNLLTTHEAQTLPKPRSFELRVQRYINFSNPPNVWPTFFEQMSDCPLRKNRSSHGDRKGRSYRSGSEQSGLSEETTACGRTYHSPQLEGPPTGRGDRSATRSKRPPQCGRSDWDCSLCLVRPTRGR